MNLDANLEKRLELIAMPYLKNGRGEFDVNHTLAAVGYMKELIKAEGGNERVLVTTVYLHDIGYPGLIKKNGLDYDEILANKGAHMGRGAAESEKILRNLGYSREEIEQIGCLIRDHDNLKELDKQGTLEAQLVFEADSLGQLAAPPTFKGEQYKEAFDWFERERVQRFKTRKGKELLGPLLENARHRYD